VLGRAGEEGQRRRLELAKHGEATWKTPYGLGKPKKTEGDASNAGNKAVSQAEGQELDSNPLKQELAGEEDE